MSDDEISAAVESMNLRELRENLKALGESPSGSKADLVQSKFELKDLLHITLSLSVTHFATAKLQRCMLVT